MSDERLPSVPGYKLVCLLGIGARSRVFEAQHLGTGRTVALKVVTCPPDDLARLRARAESLVAVRHPNLVEVLGYSEHDGAGVISKSGLLYQAAWPTR